MTYLGWLYKWGEPLTLIGENTDQILDARRELVRIGIDELEGAAVGEIGLLSAGSQMRSYRVAIRHGPRRHPARGWHHHFDVQQRRKTRAVPPRRAEHLSAQPPRPMPEVPEGEVWVHCASGYRSSIAASMIDRPGRTVVLVDDDYETAQKLDLAV